MGKRGVWLGVAAVLFALAAWLMSRGDKEKPTVKPPEVAFPRNAKPEDHARNQRHRTLPPLPRADGEEGFQARRDPLMVALPTDPSRSALVFEVGSLMDSDVGQAWLDCILAEEQAMKDEGGRGGLERFQERFGVDPLEDVERVAVSSERLAIFQGRFENATLSVDGAADWRERSYGEKGTIFEDQDTGRAMARWGDDMLLIARDTASVEDAIDRLESERAQKPAIPEWEMYGDMYGVLSPEDMAKALPEEYGEMADKIREVVRRAGVHVDASDDVAFVADVDGPDTEGMSDLAKSMGAALALGRIRAREDENEELAQLLDFAKVRSHEGRFTLEVALPSDLLKSMGPCRKRPGSEAAPSEKGNAAAPKN